MKQKNTNSILVDIFIILLLSITVIYFIIDKQSTIFVSKNVNIINTEEESLTNNSIYTTAFENTFLTFKNEVIKKNIDLSNAPYLSYLNSINSSAFNSNNFYKKVGPSTLTTKKEIIDSVTSKFDNIEKSFLDNVTFNDEKAYTLYSLYNEKLNLNYPNFKGTKYFGLDVTSSLEDKEKIDLLFFEDYDNFAFSLNIGKSKSITFYKTLNEKSITSIIKNLNEKTASYTFDKKLTANDTVKIPNIRVNLRKSYNELQNKKITNLDNREVIIENAITDVRFNLTSDAKKVKCTTSNNGRDFTLDKNFIIILRENNLNYLIVRVKDLNDF